MLPPKHCYRQGSKELEEAISKGKIVLSLPPKEAAKWMNSELGAFARKSNEGHPRPSRPNTISRSQQQQRQQQPQKQQEQQQQQLQRRGISTRDSPRFLYRNVVRAGWSNLRPGAAAPAAKAIDDKIIRSGREQPPQMMQPPSNHNQSTFFSNQNEQFSLNSGSRDLRSSIVGSQPYFPEYENAAHYAPNAFSDATVKSPYEIHTVSDMPSMQYHGDSFMTASSMNDSEQSEEVVDRDFNQERSVEPPPSEAISEKKRKRRNSTSSISTNTVVDEFEDRTGGQATKVPTSRFHDVIGHQGVKIRLQELLLPLKLSPEHYSRVFRGIRSLPASVLFHGPPGTGKTLLAQSVAGEAKAAFMSIGPSDILSKYVGESEASVRSIFSRAKQMALATESKCAVIFFDEIDALGQSRISTMSGSTGHQMETSGTDGCSRKVLAELLIQLTKLNSKNGKFRSSAKTNSIVHYGAKELQEGQEEEVEEENSNSYYQENVEDRKIEDERIDCSRQISTEQVCVLVLAATNRIEDCDPALLRRFGIQVCVGLPTLRDRVAMIKLHLKEIEHTLSDKEVVCAAHSTDGWSGSEMENLCRDCAMAPVRECIRHVVLAERRLLQDYTEDGGGYAKGEDLQSVTELDEVFTSLRPVTLDDFLVAVRMWTNRRIDSAQNEEEEGHGHSVVHYDSSSDEDES